MPGPPKTLTSKLETAETETSVSPDVVQSLPENTPVLLPQLPEAPVQLDLASLSPEDFAVEAPASPAPEPVPAPPPLTREEIRDVRQIDPQLANQIAGIQGSMQQLKDMLQELRNENKQLQEQVAHYRRLAEEAQTPDPPSLDELDIGVESLDPNEVQAFDPKHVEIINKLARHSAAKLAKPLVERLKYLEQRQKTIAEKTAQETSELKSRAFQAAVETAVPDVRQIFADEDFKGRFFDQPLSPFTDETVRDRFRQEWEAKNVSGVVRIINQYKAQKASRPASSPAPVHTQPAVSAATSENVPKKDSTAPRMLKYSLFKEATQQWTRRRISDADFNRIKAMYDDAERKGSIDYTR